VKEVTILTEHAQVLLCISAHPEWTVRQLAKELETSDRQIFRLLNDLQRTGYLTRMKEGRRNRYVLKVDVSLQEAPTADVTFAQLLTLAARQAAAGERDADAVEAHMA
jgi:DNA-binding IclR family transcriptional regulator